MYQEWLKLYEEIINNNKQIKQIKRKSKAIDKIIKLCNKYNLELSRADDVLIIRGIVDYKSNNKDKEKEEWQSFIKYNKQPFICGIDNNICSKCAVSEEYFYNYGCIYVKGFKEC